MEASYLLKGGRNGPISNCLDFALIHMNTLGRYNITQEDDLRSEKVTLLQVPIELFLR